MKQLTEPTPAKQLELDWNAYKELRAENPSPDKDDSVELDTLKSELVNRQSEVDKVASERRTQALAGLAVDHEGVVVKVEDYAPARTTSAGGRVND